MARRRARDDRADPAGHDLRQIFAGLDPIRATSSGAIWRLNDTLGSPRRRLHDAQEALKNDYVYFIADGTVAQGTTEEEKLERSVREPVHPARCRRPVPFHYPADPYEKDLELEKGLAKKRALPSPITSHAVQRAFDTRAGFELSSMRSYRGRGDRRLHRRRASRDKTADDGLADAEIGGHDRRAVEMRDALDHRRVAFEIDVGARRFNPARA